MKTINLTYILLLFCAIRGFAQNNFKLTVLSKRDSLPLSGAIVRVNFHSPPQRTNERGEMDLELINGKHELTINYLGYQEKIVLINVPSERNLSIYLESNVTELQEVEISTGYAKFDQKSATGSAFGVDAKLLNRSVGSNILDRLRDVVPGLIFNKTGNTAANPISIRGQNTIYANSQPLIVLDNFPFTGDLGSINPNDIESISVLKDAAASAIWGARSGNGVIIINTKSGGVKKPSFSLNVGTDIGEKPDLFYKPRIGSAEFIELEKMLFARGYYNSTENSISRTALSPVVEILIAKRDGKLSADQADNQIESLKNFDLRNEYTDLLSRQTLNNRVGLSLSGGSAQNNYYLGGGYDKTLLSDVGNKSQRYTFSFRNNYSLLEGKLNAEFQIRYAELGIQQNNSGYSSLNLSNGIPLYPYARLRDDQGASAIVTKDLRTSFVQNVPGSMLNWDYRPLDEVSLNDNHRTTINYSGQFNLRYKIINGLELSTLYQYAQENVNTANLQSELSYSARHLINSYSKVNADNSVTRPIPLGGILDNLSSKSLSKNFRGQLTYNRRLADHQIFLFAGAEIIDRNTSALSGRLYGYDAEHAISLPVDYKSGFPLYYAPASTNNLIPNKETSTFLIDRFVSYYINGNYNYKDRYFLSGSIRKDKSNIFGVNTNQKGVPLWSVGAAWSISQEKFYDNSFYPEIKARISFGYNGNLDRGVSAYTTASFLPSAPETKLPYAQIQNPPNPELRWEKIATLNLGLDFKLKNGLLNGSVDYFTKTGSDIIGLSPYAPSSGITSFYGNVANTKTQGIDLVMTSNIFIGGLTWQSSLLYSYTKERVTDYALNATATSYVGSQGIPMKGRPLYSIYYYRFAGLDPQTGDPLGYVDGAVSKDYAKILASYNSSNLPFAGSSRPVHFGSFRSTFTFKQLSVSANVSYRLGYYFRKTSVNFSEILTAKGGHLDYIERWQAPGDELRSDIPSQPLVSNASRDNFYLNSSALVLKADHIRLQDIRLDYTLEKLKKLHIRQAKVFIYAQNLGLIWTENKYSLDPDFLLTQPIKTISFGFQLTL